MTFDTATLAIIYSLIAQIEALKAEIISMKFKNKERLFKNMALAYDESSFQEKADQLWGISRELQELGR